MKRKAPRGNPRADALESIADRSQLSLHLGGGREPLCPCWRASPAKEAGQVGVDAGSSSGVQINDPVVDGDGLVGRVTDVTHNTSQVSLITDNRSAVSARVLPSGPDGVAEPEVGNPSTLLLDFIDKNQPIHQGQIVVTAGWSNGAISSAYPPGIPIGKVSDATVGEQTTYQRVHLTPFADMRGLDYVQIATGGPKRPGVVQ